MKQQSIELKIIVIGIVSLFLISGALPSVTSLQKQRVDIPILPRTIRVNDDGNGDYISIKQAIIHANTGDTIEVYSGTYYEHNITIEKTLTILGLPYDLGSGPDEGKPVIVGDNGENSTLFIITADHVTLAGFHITNEVENRNRTAYAIILTSSDFTTISNNIIQKNFFGIRLEESNNNIITNNEIFNNWIGLFVGSLGGGAGSCSNQITDNYIHSNKRRGIHLSTGTNNVIHNNQLTNNKLNFAVMGTRIQDFLHTIDMSNTIESKPILYLVNQQNIQISSDVGYLGLINCKNINVKNIAISWNQEGILIVNTTDSTIDNVTITNTIDGLHFFNSTRNTITNCTLSVNEKGIYLSTFSNENKIDGNTLHYNMLGVLVERSSHNRLFHNMIISNNYGLFGQGQNNDIVENIFQFNLYDIRQFSSNYFSANLFSHTLQPQMISFKEVPRIVSLNGKVNISFLLYSPNGAPNNGHTYNIRTSPEEPLSIVQHQNNVTIEFHVTRLGTYSVIIDVTDEFGNTASRIVTFYVNPTGLETTKYYLRVIEPTHGQPLSYVSTDAFTFLFSPPETMEWERCAMWVQNSPDELPGQYPLSILKDMTISSWIRFNSGSTMGFHGIALERYATYNMILGNGYDRYIWLEQPTTYTWFDVDLMGLNWGMDYSWSWYWYALKLQGGGPFWMTKPQRPSTLNITSLYTTTPAVKSLSNTDITIYSATSPPNDLNTATICIEGTGTANLVVQMQNPGFIYSVAFDGETFGNKNFSMTQQNGELTLQFRAHSQHTFDITAIPNGIQLDGLCSYTYDDHSDNINVQIMNLNTGRSWLANTMDDRYSLVLSSISDVHAGDILRFTVTDDQANYNITDHVVTEAEILGGHISLDFAINFHYRTLEQFPFYLSTIDSGATTMKMMLDYLQWNSTQFPQGPQNQHNEQYYTDIYSGDDERINEDELAFGLNAEIDDISHHWEYGYFYQPSTQSNANDALRDVVVWFDYAVSTFNNQRTTPIPKEGYPNHTPVAVPLDGTYDHWVTIRGIQTDRSAWNGQQMITGPISIFGLWVNDPTPGGLGENTFVETSWFLSQYYKPITIQGDQNYDRYVSVVDPPRDVPLVPQMIHVHATKLPTSHTAIVSPVQRDEFMTYCAVEHTNAVLQYTSFHETFLNAVQVGTPIYHENKCMVTFQDNDIVFQVILQDVSGDLLELHID